MTRSRWCIGCPTRAAMSTRAGTQWPCRLRAATVHDRALLEDLDLVRTAGAAATLALENERLAAELRARYDDLRAASARVVTAGDAARRRLERDLHDGAQQRLVSLSVTLNLARRHAAPGSPIASLLDSGLKELTSGLSELRELA